MPRLISVFAGCTGHFVVLSCSSSFIRYILAPNRAKVFGVETSPAELEAVLEKCRDHRQNVQQLLLKQEYQRSQAAMRQKMLENLDDSIKGQKSKVSMWAMSQVNLSLEVCDPVCLKPVYSASQDAQRLGFCVNTNFSNYTIQPAYNKGADLTARMRRLICAIVVCIWHKAGFLMTWLGYVVLAFTIGYTLAEVLIVIISLKNFQIMSYPVRKSAIGD